MTLFELRLGRTCSRVLATFGVISDQRDGPKGPSSRTDSICIPVDAFAKEAKQIRCVRTRSEIANA